MSPFFRALMANISPVILYSAKSTCREEHFSFLPLYSTAAEIIWLLKTIFRTALKLKSHLKKNCYHLEVIEQILNKLLKEMSMMSQ